MSTIKNKIEAFLLNHTVWVFLILLFLFNHGWVLFLGNSSYQYLEISKWVDYLTRALWWCLLFAPLLLFALFRQKIQQQLTTTKYWALWSYCFLIHPFLIGQFDVQNIFLRPKIDGGIVWVWATNFVIVELLLRFNDFFSKKLNLKKRMPHFNLEKFLLAGLVLFSLLYAYIKQAVYDGYYLSSAIQHLLFFGIFYAFYWVNHYVLMDQVFRQRGVIYYGFSFIGLALVCYPFIALAIYWFPVLGDLKILLDSDYWVPQSEAPSTTFYVMPSTFPLLGMVVSVPFVVILQWFKQSSQIAVLEKERADSELNALKQQINPHFLFNTLNSLYALGIEEDSEKTADGIAKLGTLLRYNLNDTQRPFIPLQKEMDYLQKYIELQKLRLAPNNQLTVELPNTNDTDYQIAPLLLIPFIENAFKFGGSATEETDIKLSIRLEEGTLNMELFNTIAKSGQQHESNGIGIANTRKRLAHLYPQRHELVLEETAEAFEVQLKIEL
ncbi:MAG: histidine kinase [Bacteroidota bacterium]